MKKRLLWFLDNVAGRIVGIALVIFMFLCDRKISPTIINGMDCLLVISVIICVVLLLNPLTKIWNKIKNSHREWKKILKAEAGDDEEDDWDIPIK